MTAGTGEDEPPLADLLARAVAAHPSVVALHGGQHGLVASYLPGRRVIGVRATLPGEPVALSVVLRTGTPIPAVVAELRQVVRALAGDVTVDVTVVDLVVANGLW